MELLFLKRLFIVEKICHAQDSEGILLDPPVPSPSFTNSQHFAHLFSSLPNFFFLLE